MRLIYICQNFGEPRSSVGSTRHYEVVRRLLERGWRVHLITTDMRMPPSGADRVREAFGAAFDLEIIGTSYTNQMSFSRRKLEFLRIAGLMVLRALRPAGDVVLVSSTPLTIALPALARRATRRTPFVFEVRDLWPEVPFAFGALRPTSWQGRAATWLARSTYRRASRIIALSPGMAEGIVDGYDVDPAKLHLAPNASDGVPPGDAASSAPGDEDTRSWFTDADHRFVYGGTIGRANDVGWLVRVFDACIEDHGMDAKLLIVGDGAELEAVEAAVRACRGATSDRIRVIGRRPKVDFVRLLERATLSFNLVRDDHRMRDASPNKVFDSLAVGVPVASNQGGWLAEMLDDFGAGVELPRETTIAATVLAGLDDRAMVGLVEGTHRAAARFTWDVTAASIAEALSAARSSR